MFWNPFSRRALLLKSRAIKVHWKTTIENRLKAADKLHKEKKFSVVQKAESVTPHPQLSGAIISSDINFGIFRNTAATGSNL